MTEFEPGIFDMPEADYHASEALSSSGARKLLPPSCPALFRWEQDHPVYKDVFDFGSAAHKLVLGAGPSIACVEADDWRTNKAKEVRDAIRADGGIPLLRKDYETVQAMADALRAHKLAASLLCRDDVQTEQSLFWVDEESGIQRRARVDAMRPPSDTTPRIIADFKTTRSADPASFAKSVVNFGYFQQDAWYRDAALAVFGDEPEFFFVAIDKEPPYLVSVFMLDEAAVKAGRELNRQAIEVFAECSATGVWPGYASEFDYSVISLPGWARSREDTYA